MDQLFNIGDRVETNEKWFNIVGTIMPGVIVEVIPCNSSYYPGIYYKIDMGEYGSDYIPQDFLLKLENVREVA